MQSGVHFCWYMGDVASMWLEPWRMGLSLRKGCCKDIVQVPIHVTFTSAISSFTAYLYNLKCTETGINILSPMDYITPLAISL